MAPARSRKLWGGRFSQATDPVVERYTSSLAVDQRLAVYDVDGSIAHAKMLGRCRIIPAADSRRLVTGLQRVRRVVAAPGWRPDHRAEDVHTAMQQLLERTIGPVARTLHTARSRNDQVSLDLRLYCRDAVARVQQAIVRVQQALIQLASGHTRTVIPGYTHLQRGQPIVLAHQLLAYVEMLARDSERLVSVERRINVLPLGAGALAGTSLPIDRAYVAKLLGFPRIALNSLDAVADRDFVMELLSAAAILGVNLSRMAEDLILWSTEEFGILALDDAVATGSSLMPQKKNPDVLELLRGQAGLVIGQLTAFLTVMKGLPLTYNRDLQWDKRLLFESIDLTRDGLDVFARFLGHVRVRTDQLNRLLETDSLCATDLADHLVQRGVAFSDAHRIVGTLVALSERQGKRLQELQMNELQQVSTLFDAHAREILDPNRSVWRKRSVGSPNPRLVAQAIARWRRRLNTR